MITAEQYGMIQKFQTEEREAMVALFENHSLNNYEAWINSGKKLEEYLWSLTRKPESETNQLDYKTLFGQAIEHLRAVSGSRNSFNPETRQLLLDYSISLERPEAVLEMHKSALEFLKEHDKPVQTLQSIMGCNHDL